MKNFKTLTELQVLNYACDRLLEIYLRELDIYNDTKSELASQRKERARIKFEEVRDEVIRPEQLNKKAI